MIKRISSRLRHQVNYALLATGKDSSSRSTKRSHQPKCTTLQSKQDEPVDANLHTPPSSPANTEHDHDPNKQDNDDKDEQLSLESFLNCDIDENFFRKYGSGSATAADPTASSSIKGRRGRPKRQLSNSETGTDPNTSTTHNDRAEISPESLLSGRSPRKRVRSSLLRQYDIDNGGQMINVSGVVRRPRRRIFDESTVTDMDLSAQNSGSKNFKKSTTTILRPKVKVDEIIRPKIRLLQKSFLAADSTDLKAYSGVRRSRKQRRRIETVNRNSCDVDVQIANNKHNNASSTTTSNNSARESSVTGSDQTGNSSSSKKTGAKLKQPDNGESISADDNKIRRKSLPRRHLKLPLALSSEEFDLGRNIAIPQLLLNKSWNYSKRLRKCPQSGYYRSLMAPARRAPNHQKRNVNS